MSVCWRTIGGSAPPIKTLLVAAYRLRAALQHVAASPSVLLARNESVTCA
jgi:hypothetical protein